MVLLDVNTFLSPRGGGIRTYHAHKAAWFSARPDDTYLTAEPGRHPKEEAGPSPNVIRLIVPGPSYHPNYRVLWQFGFLDRIIEGRQVDVVEAGDPWFTARWASGLTRPVRTSFWHSDPPTAYLDPWIRSGRVSRPLRILVSRMAQIWIRRFQKRMDLVWCASRWAAARLRERGVTRVEVNPFGIDHAVFQPRLRDPDLLLRLGLDPARPVLLYVGRIDPEKGIATLLKAVPDLISLPGRPQVVLAGSGILEDRARALDGTDLRMLGFLKDQQVLAGLYASSDLLIAPCGVETFGIAVLESLVLGLPVLAADNGGGAELVCDAGAGGLFRTGDSADLTRRAAALLPVANDLRARATAFGATWPSWDAFFARQNARVRELVDAR